MHLRVISVSDGLTSHGNVNIQRVFRQASVGKQICTGFEQDLSSDPGSLLLQLMHVQSVVAGFHWSMYETESVPNSNA